MPQVSPPGHIRASENPGKPRRNIPGRTHRLAAAHVDERHDYLVESMLFQECGSFRPHRCDAPLRSTAAFSPVRVRPTRTLGVILPRMAVGCCPYSLYRW